MIALKSDKIITENGVLSGYVYINGDKIVQISECKQPADIFYDYTGKYVSPGFIEIHSHGAGGYSFTGSEQDVINACNNHLKHGVTTILPTVTTAPFNVMREAVKSIKAAKESHKAPNIYGAHLEGPYLSPAQCGAQNPGHITPPVKKDYESLVELYGDVIKRWTYAPENDKNGEFCSYITNNGILASAGHTDATYDDIKTALNCGCRLVTHLYSATSTVTRKQGFRFLGVIESAFLRDELYVEIIADGKHLPPDLIKMIVKIKGEDKVILVTDSLQIADTDIKSGNLSGIDYIVEEGVCRLTDRSAFAGSIATADTLIKVVAYDCGYGIPAAVKMLSQNPAELLKLNKGSIAPGKEADIVVFDNDIKISDVFIGGVKQI